MPSSPGASTTRIGGWKLTTPQSFHSRLAAMLVGELVNKGSVAVAFFWLARTLDPAAYGEVEWSLSLTVIFILAADAGLATWGAAEVAARPDETPSLVARVGWLRLALAAPAYLLLLLAAWSRGGPAGSALAIYGLTLFLTPLFLQYMFDGLLQTRWAALGNALRGLTFLGVTLLLVQRGSSPSSVAIAEVIAVCAFASFNLLVARKVLKLPMRIRDDRRGVRAMLARSWRVGASELTWGVHAYAGLIFLGYVAAPQDTAWHSASLRLLLAIHTGVWLYLSTLLPNLVRLLRHDPDGWRQRVERSLRLTSWVGYGVALAGTLAAGTILTTVFGPPFAASVPGFRALTWVVPIAWIGGHIRYSLIAAERPEREYWARLIGAGTTILLTLLLVPPFRSAGAGIALLGGTIANTVAAWALARGVLPGCSYGKSVALSSAGCLACLSLGALLSPAIGEVPATLLAAAVMVTSGLVAERETVRELLKTVAGGRRSTAQ